jgi:hypothetical protein
MPARACCSIRAKPDGFELMKSLDSRTTGTAANSGGQARTIHPNALENKQTNPLTNGTKALTEGHD